MDRIPTANDGALGGNRDTVAGPMAGWPHGRFGDRRVSEAPEGPRPHLRTRQTDAAKSTPPDRLPRGGQWPAGVTVGSVTDTPGTSSVASAAGNVGERPGSLSEPSPKRTYRSMWNMFVRWCEERSVRHLPASPETVADYLTERAEHCNLTTLQKNTNRHIEDARCGRVRGPLRKGCRQVDARATGCRQGRGTLPEQEGQRWFSRCGRYRIDPGGRLCAPAARQRCREPRFCHAPGAGRTCALLVGTRSRLAVRTGGGT